ncbi:biotin/lipoyl-containing protein, partial [Streptomyces triculaminicus]|uniref:acetyl-CoA carboxylase biotin carboxyl carrier protein subunit n=1 Tax=Streptomyces triculaminicus TaxID=2816232 RepID=UPI0033DE2C27
VTDPAFTSSPFHIHTRWIETEFDNTITPFTGVTPDEDEETPGRETVVVEVGGKRLEVTLPASLGAVAAAPATARPKQRRTARKSGPAASGDALMSPMQGTIVKVAVADGQEVQEGDLVIVLEAMKMEQPLNAHRSGTVKDLAAEVGASVSSGAVICTIKD